MAKRPATGKGAATPKGPRAKTSGKKTASPKSTASAPHIVAQFEIRRRSYLDNKGKPIADLPPLGADREALSAIYRDMVMNRQFDARCVSLQRTGQLGTFASALGQEAVMAGVAHAMHDDDVFFPTYREGGVLLARGVTPTELFAYWCGEERGMDFAVPKRDFPICITIASHLPHAAGVASSMMLRDEPRVAVAMLGDGATSKGDFYEALNLAGSWNLPLVIVINNNRWAISMRRDQTSAAETLAQKAIAGGVACEQVDGFDAIAVRQAAGEAIERARNGGGASVIEMISYRLTDHTTADDAKRYRTEKEVSAEWANDPVARLRDYLAGQGWWKKADEEGLIEDCKSRLDGAWAAYQQMPPESPATMFDYLFETLPEQFVAQRNILAEQADG